MTDKRRELLQAAADEVRATAWMPAYRDQSTDEENLGMALANWSEWDGDRIVEVCLAALEDANFHRERALLEAAWHADNMTARPKGWNVAET